MRELPTYTRLFVFLFIGLALVGGGTLLRVRQPSLAGILSIAGLLVQAVAGMLLAYRFAKGLGRRGE